MLTLGIQDADSGTADWIGNIGNTSSNGHLQNEKPTNTLNYIINVQSLYNVNFIEQTEKNVSINVPL